MNPGFGIYVHWPFCQAKCPYCDFNSHVWGSVDQDEWVATFLSEIDRVYEMVPDHIVRSIFFGGGTPSLMNVSTIESILERISSKWRMENDVEVTLEANPTSIEASRFHGYRAAGVNRVSVGVQALNDPDLKALGRLHSAREALDAVDVARSTFDRVSFDLIYARQNQSVSDWDAELRQALSFDPNHLSLYQLTIEDGTAFGDRFARGTLRGLPSEDLAADMWDVTQALTTTAGLPAYEISNHARSEQESRHNLIYWSSGDWAGIGPGAHGRLTMNGVRYEMSSIKDPRAWATQVKSKKAPNELFARLTETDIFHERIMMGLRMSNGISVSLSPDLLNKINMLEKADLLEFDGDTLRMTPKGRPLLNSILNTLLLD